MSHWLRRALCGVALLAAWAAFTPGVASATVTLSHYVNPTTGQVDYDIYTNDQGTFYIARHCLGSTYSDSATHDAAGTPWVASVGPGYIFRADYGGREMVVPQPANRPQTGIGAFAIDVYRGISDGTTATDSSGNGYGAYWGNICKGDPNAIAGADQRGVTDTGDTIPAGGVGTASQATGTSYLWVHYLVHIGDAQARLLSIEYDYRFYSDRVELWTNVVQCPDGYCGGSPYTFVKMPKYSAVASGPNAGYTTATCLNSAGTALMSTTQLTDPQHNTGGNHCNNNARNYIVFSGNPNTSLNLKVMGQAYPGNASSPATSGWAGSAGQQWEANSSNIGLDQWAVYAQFAPLLELPVGGGGCPNYAGQTGSNGATYSWYDANRNWEFGGDDGTHTGTGGYLGKAEYANFKGWEDGVGFNSCHTLFDELQGNQYWGSYFKVKIGTGTAW